MSVTKRPWGTYEVLLDDDNCKVKKIIVNPGENPSYQYHHKRAEDWIFISGNGEVCINDKIINVTSESRIHVPVLAKHTVKNTGNSKLVFIEIQTGKYFGEDDIVRLEDKYGRA